MRNYRRPISYANHEILPMMNERTEENVMREPLHKTRMRWKMAEGRFASVCSVEELILRGRKEKYRSKNEQDIRLLGSFLKTKVEDRKVEAISAVELNEYISHFIISVRTKNGIEYEPTSLRSLTASFCQDNQRLWTLSDFENFFYVFHSSICEICLRNITRKNLHSLVCFLILLDSSIKIVRSHFPWSNLKIS